MNIIKIESGVVVSVESIAEGTKAVLSDKAPYVGSLLVGDHFIAPSTAVLVDNGVVIQVAISQWAIDKAIPDSGEWIDTNQEVVVGYLYDGVDFTPPPAPRNIAAEVAAHAIELKVGIVNATRTDGLIDPVTATAVAAIEERYNLYVTRFLTDDKLGLDVTDKIPVVQSIRAGQDFFDAVDLAAATILAAGDAADPIADDARWPALPA